MTCPAGTYSGDAATECTDCAAGTYSTVTGATSCVACPGGTYQDAAGATDCVDCAADNDDDEPGHYSTYSDGAASQSECVCETGWAGELCTVTSCATVATISLGHMLLMANPLTRAYIGTTAAVDDTVTVTNDVRSALQEWDLDSNNILTYAEVTACLATYHVNVTNLDDANNYVWSVPVPEPIVASTDDCETADSLYTVSIVQDTGAISDTDDFKIRAFGNNDVKLSYSCEVWDRPTHLAGPPALPFFFGPTAPLRELRPRLASSTYGPDRASHPDPGRALRSSAGPARPTSAIFADRALRHALRSDFGPTAK